MDPADDERDTDAGESGERRGSMDDLADAKAVTEEHGYFLIVRYIGQVEGQDAFKPVAAKLVGAGSAGQLRIGDEGYALNLEDLEEAVTNPQTYNPDEDGPPHPIDVLRDPPQPE